MDKKQFDTSDVSKTQIGELIDRVKVKTEQQRLNFRRRWYDNNFFDDGYHFRFISRNTGRIIDLTNKSNVYAPSRAIPKASRQIRGMANLLVSQDFIPVIYPEKVTRVNYSNEPVLQNGQPVLGKDGKPITEYDIAREDAKVTAKKIGHWLQEEFKNQDIDIKLAQMMILTMKHGVSFLQVWPDVVEEKIKTRVYDAFDIYLMGNLDSIYDSPFIGKAVPKTIKEIKANENFDKEQVSKLSPDNKYASDEVKEAYVTSKYGNDTPDDATATIILNEFYFKEYLNEENLSVIARQKNSSDILKGKKKGDQVIRQTFSAGGVVLKDCYVAIKEYPFVDLRLEPGPIYQTPQIERFIPANKSLDVIVSRIEQYINMSPLGIWMKRRGENFGLNNMSGGLMVNYNQTAPTQQTLAPLPNFVFETINMYQSFIEEQGVTTSALGKLPKGVKANAAIETLKESEFANLTINLKMLKKCLKNIAERFIDLADDYFINPTTVERLEKGEPDYFDLIGSRGYEAYEKIGRAKELGNTVKLSKEYRVDIQIESGMAFTSGGKKAAMSEYIRNYGSYGGSRKSRTIYRKSDTGS
jgi:hypothetical protein